MNKLTRSLIPIGALFAVLSAMALYTSASTREQFARAIGVTLSDFLFGDDLSDPTATLVSTSPSESFFFLEPIAPGGGDPGQFDATLLDHLAVEICQVNESDCVVVKTFSAQGQGSEELRIPNNAHYYIVNWDTQRVNLNDATYRVRVLLASVQLGSVDLTPSVYDAFGRTWPIKFLVERDPEIRFHLLRSLGRSCSQSASALKDAFGLSAEQVALVLAGGERPCSPEEIDLALRGVYQAPVIPSTTKISDEATRNALVSFDPIGGRMVFSSKTGVLNRLSRGDVLVSEPSAAAPFGYLRKIGSIKNQGGGVVLDTIQASFNDAIRQGTLDAAATLRPEDLLVTEPALPGVTFRTLSKDPETQRLAGVIGEDYDFETAFDVTLQGSASGDGVNGDGHVRIQGYIRFNAGYDVGFGVEPCFEVPPTCVDRAEARLGIDHYSNIRVSGEFNGTLQKEIKLATHHFKPIVFFIGPIPVVIVPVIDAVVGTNGEAHLRFSFAAELSAQLLLGAKWTEENGWEDLSRKNGFRPGITEQNLDANMKLRAYGKADGKLLFYGVAGPGFASRVGGGADVQVPRRPWWRIFGYIGASINFQVDLGGLLKLSDFSRSVLDEEFTLVDAPNQAPHFSNVNTGVIQADIATAITLGPRSGFFGHFDVMDREGDSFTLSASSNVDGLLLDNGVPTMTYAFQTGGLRTITITATDSQGASSTVTLMVNVNNSQPIVTVTAADNTVPAMVQYFVSARAFDFESGVLSCDRLGFAAAPSGTITRTDSGGTCSATIVFSAEGLHTVTVTATDPQGGVGTGSISVNVTPVPSNLPPVIDDSTFRVLAIPRAGTPRGNCSIFVSHCPVEDNAVLFNGEGDYDTPLQMTVQASDPEGQVVTFQWVCRTGTRENLGVPLGNGFYSCTPPFPLNSTEKVEVFAIASDAGGGTQKSRVRTLLWGTRVN